MHHQRTAVLLATACASFLTPAPNKKAVRRELKIGSFLVHDGIATIINSSTVSPWLFK